jgi:hypothetical protein
MPSFTTFVQGDMSISEYCHCLKGMADALDDLGEVVLDHSPVLTMLRGLNGCFSYMATLLKQQRPFLTFAVVHNDLQLEEIMLASKPGSFTTALVASTTAVGMLLLPHQVSRHPSVRLRLATPWPRRTTTVRTTLSRAAPTNSRVAPANNSASSLLPRLQTYGSDPSSSTELPWRLWFAWASSGHATTAPATGAPGATGPNFYIPGGSQYAVELWSILRFPCYPTTGFRCPLGLLHRTGRLRHTSSAMCHLGSVGPRPRLPDHVSHPTANRGVVHGYRCRQSYDL